MTRRKRIAVASPCALLVLLLAPAADAEEQAPKEERRHIFLAHLTTAPIYGARVYTGPDHDKPGDYTPLNIGVRADYEYRFGWTHFGVGARYNYALLNNHVPYFRTHEIDVPLLVTMEKNLGSGNSIGVTFGLGYYMGISRVYGSSCSCFQEYEPNHGAHTEALFLYTKEVSQGLDFSVRTGINAGMTYYGPGDSRMRYSFPIELGLRARW